MADQSTKCLIVGAGPVGALSALYAAKRGWEVEVYELREDLRDDSTNPLNFTKSINLALSERGINAMRGTGSANLLSSVLKETIPMYGRMIHGEDTHGNLTEEVQLYDVHGRYIRAVDRANLNKLLLDELEGLHNVKFFFNHKLTGADFQKRRAWFEQNFCRSDKDKQTRTNERPKEIEVAFDLILGCDGAHSSVRYHMMKFVRMNFEQTYIDTLWCEFTIPAATSTSTATLKGSSGYAISPNHLHIWPGADKMFIAIPSLDKTFTCTLFASSADFAALEKHPDQILKFFQANFPGAAKLVGEAGLRLQFQQNPHLPLISVKCSPHHFGSSGVILGDASHAMVPFYGQGMNAGLEDVRVLFQHLDSHPQSAEGREHALAAYSSERVPDAHAINDLALANYWEMHAGVLSPIYLLRKTVEEFLSDKFPSSGFVTQYSRVSFSNQRYSEVVQAVAKQRIILICGMMSTFAIPLMGLLTTWAWRWHRDGRGEIIGMKLISGLCEKFRKPFASLKKY
ncbi:hypothetical protein M433DRAFT_110387 [Acidomyces richmondensis BFW]|nr:MAG: hypothetical protein FE78DRAFT_109248 [Acidomyces sp. 'richmondensis']KYG44324.1 hypothetical protein M433DRAFT_110387 [Acidomyces richmondensis BFW]